MPDEDDGWGGTLDEGWTSLGHPVLPPTGQQPTQIVPALPGGPPRQPGPGAPSLPATPAGPLGPPPPYYPPYSPPGYQPSSPHGGRAPSGNRTLAVVVGVIVLVAAVVLAVVLLNSSDSSPHTATTDPPSSRALNSTADGGGGAKGLVARAPSSFAAECSTVPSSSFDTSSVVDQIACSGSQVQSAVSAEGVSYAQFGDEAGLESWYTNTILGPNNIVANSGNCSTGSTVNTTSGATFCESGFTDSHGSNARQTVVLAPAGVTLTNGPNSTATDCPNSPFTLIVFTSSTDHVGVVALTCTASASAAQALESSLAGGAFALRS